MKENEKEDRDQQLQIDLEIASFVLRSGGTLVYPTETVWGIGCDATDEEAVDLVFELKKTRDRKALLVLVDSPEMLKEYVKKIPNSALQVLKEAEKPTTIIYPEAKNLASNVVAEDGSIGIRITTNPFCLELLKRFKKPIVSTSANFSGEETPSKFDDINIDLVYNADYVVRSEQINQILSEPSRIIKILENGETVTIR